jgi:hypothetical protein
MTGCGVAFAAATELHELFSVARNSAARALRLVCREEWMSLRKVGGHS